MNEPRDADFTGPRDSYHERAHEVVKDLLNGRLSQPTRDQLGRALSTPVAPPEGGKPLPRGALR